MNAVPTTQTHPRRRHGRRRPAGPDDAPGRDRARPVAAGAGRRTRRSCGAGHPRRGDRRAHRPRRAAPCGRGRRRSRSTTSTCRPSSSEKLVAEGVNVAPAAGGADPRPGQAGDAARGWRRSGRRCRGCAEVTDAGRRGRVRRRASAGRSCSRPRAAATTAAACCWPDDLDEARDLAAAISPTASRCWSRSAWRCGASWPRWSPGRRSARPRRGRWWRPCSATASASR